MGRTLFSILRLWLGCFGILWGISWAFLPALPRSEKPVPVLEKAPATPDNTSILHVWGLVIGSAGLAMTLQETVYIHSRFMRGVEK